METRERPVLSYKTVSGRFPFREWRDGITDGDIKAIIDARVARMRGGNFGCSEPIGNGALENKIDYGPGFRIYYAIAGNDIVLLGGGDKPTQDADIKAARANWKDYKQREKQRRELLKRNAKETQ